MGSSSSKRTSSRFPGNSMKDNSTCTQQRDLNQKPKLCELPLQTEANGHICTQESHSGDEEDIFYRFVILHADVDVEEAIRVQELLQNEFCIKPGIIFAEMPSGRHVLENLQNAMNDSAWTIILLTENFLKELWCEFQSYASLFNAVTTPHKCNTVIPMRPRNNPLSQKQIPFILQTINALQEESPGFAEQVKKTFKESSYKQQQAIWRNGKKKGMPRELLGW